MAIKDKSNSSLNLQVTPQQLRCFLDLGARLHNFRISAKHFLRAQTEHRKVQNQRCRFVWKERSITCAHGNAHTSPLVPR